MATQDQDTLQNENLYLGADKDSAIIKEIMTRQLYYRQNASEENRYYSDAISYYNKFIKLIAQFIKELGLGDNSIVLSILLRKLLFEGYFSKDNCFKADSKQSFYDIGFFEGMDVIRGKGCCRHLASFHDAIFKELGNYSQIFTCYYGSLDTTLSEALVNSANHAANLIKSDGLIYVYDSFRNYILRPIDRFTVEGIVDYEEYIPIKFYYKPSVGVMACHTTFDEGMNMLNLLEEDSKKTHINYIKYMEHKKLVEDIFLKNYISFVDFKSEGKKYTRKIFDGMKQGYVGLVEDFYRRY